MNFTNHRSSAITRLLDELSVDLDSLTNTIVEAIRRDVSSYRSFPLDRHRADSARGLAVIVAGLRDNRAPSADATMHAATIGRDRARFGIPLIDAVEGYHVVYRELWNTVLTRAQQEGPAVTAELSREVGLLWTWVHRASAAFATAHAAETARVQVGLQESRSRLIALLLSESPPARTVSAVAASLGFDPEGAFVVICAGPATIDESDAVNARFEEGGITAHCSLDTAERIVAVGQGVNTARMVNTLRDVTGARVGVGAVGFGVSGATQSVEDAGIALAVTTSTHPVVDFATRWPTALLGAHPSRIAHVVADGTAIAYDNPHLAETVQAFAASRFSVSAAARVLQVHANTATYRLERWMQLTGWDVFTADGLTASLVAIDREALAR